MDAAQLKPPESSRGFPDDFVPLRVTEDGSANRREHGKACLRQIRPLRESQRVNADFIRIEVHDLEARVDADDLRRNQCGVDEHGSLELFVELGETALSRGMNCEEQAQLRAVF